MKPAAGRTPAFADSSSEARASAWPEVSRPGDLSGSGFVISRFDPAAEERSRLKGQAWAAFDVCHPGLALRALLVVQVALALVALGGADSLSHWGARQAAAAYCGAAGSLAWLVAVCALKRPLAALGAGWRALLVVLLGALAALLVSAPLAWVGLLGEARAFALAGTACAGAAFGAALWGWLDLRARMWHPASTRARLAELQSRIRPHFLFNALNTALALVRVDPGRAEAVLEDLAELFRVGLAEVGEAVSLREEIALAQRYLAIEQVRFGPRLAVRWDVDERVLHARVPPLVLQPLVENAVRHGIEPSRQGGWLHVRAFVQRGQAVVIVSNTLAEQPGAPGHGMALHNVRERLRLLHDVAAQCDVWQDTSEGGTAQFHARIRLPLP